MDQERYLPQDDEDEEKSQQHHHSGYADDFDVESVTSTSSDPSALDLPDTVAETECKRLDAAEEQRQRPSVSSQCKVLARALGYLICALLVVLATLVLKHLLTPPSLDSTDCENGVATCPLTGMQYPCDVDSDERVTCVRYDLCRPVGNACGVGVCAYNIDEAMYMCVCDSESRLDETSGQCVMSHVDSVAEATGDSSSSSAVTSASSTMSSSSIAAIDSSTASSIMDATSQWSSTGGDGGGATNQDGTSSSAVLEALSSTGLSESTLYGRSSSDSIGSPSSSSVVIIDSSSAPVSSSACDLPSSSSGIDSSSSSVIALSSSSVIALSSSSVLALSSSSDPIEESSSSSLAISSSSALAIPSSSSAPHPSSSTATSSSSTAFSPPPMSLILTADFTAQPCIGFAIYTERASHTLLDAAPSLQSTSSYFILTRDTVRTFDRNTYYTTLHSTRPDFAQNQRVFPAERDQVLYITSLDCTTYCLGVLETATWLIGNKITATQFANCGIPDITPSASTVLSVHTDDQGNVIVVVTAPSNRVYVTVWSRRLTTCIYTIFAARRLSLPRTFYDEDVNRLYLMYVDSTIVRVDLGTQTIDVAPNTANGCVLSAFFMNQNRKWLWFRPAELDTSDLSLLDATRLTFSADSVPIDISCAIALFPDSSMLVNARMVSVPRQAIGVPPVYQVSVLYNQTKIVTYSCNAI